MIKNRIIEFGETLQNLNYKYEVYPLKKEKEGISFRSYNFLPAGSQVLFQELLSRSQQGEVIYDIGAHRGHWAIPLANAGRRVIAFEPNPIAYDQLQKKRPSQRLRDGDFQYRYRRRGGGNDILSFVSSSREFLFKPNTKRSGEIIGTTEVRIDTLEGMYSEYDLPKPDHIKIDAEGMGPQVLYGGESLIKECGSQIYLELHPDTDGELQEEETKSLLTNWGYSINILDEGSLGYEGGHPWVCQPIK